jgi:predicted PurR-regulated permease PerM
MSESNTVDRQGVRLSIEIAVTLFLIAIIVAWCLQILAPFVSFIVWGAVIAIAMHKPFLKLSSAVGSRLGITLFTVVGLAVILVPSFLFAESLIGSSARLAEEIGNGTLNVPPPNETVRAWPLIGEKLFQAWSAAASDLGDFLQRHSDQVLTVGGTLLGKLAGTGLSILQFVLSLVISAVFLSHAESAAAAALRFSNRLVGTGGQDMLNLAVSTIRSVAVGVLGIAFIQAVLAGAGLLAVGVPAAGLWALFVLILAIAQLPPILILGPICFYVFANESTVVSVVFLVWSLIVSFSDAVLKPLFLGRGVEAPMLVILLGAIGGMILSGIIGLFVGAVVLALGYKLFQGWLEMGEESGSQPADSPAVSDPPSGADG